MSTLPPDELRTRPRWVLWRRENGTKVPYSAASRRKASTTDPTTWTSYDRAWRVYEAALGRSDEYAGVGYVFSADDPYTGIDLDDCIDAGGQLEPWARTIVDTMQTYTEVSPSGTGVKMWVIGSVPSSVKTKQIEIYTQARYFAFTGNQLPGTPGTIRSVNGDLTALYDSLKPKQAPRSDLERSIPQLVADSDYSRRWCLAALEGEQAKMRDAGEGERHNRRYDSAHALGGLVHTGGLTEHEIADALAINFGANEAGARKTISDGIKAGKEHPRTIPTHDRPQPTFDADGYACCPTHGEQLITCHNGNGWRCRAPKMGEPLCFWWQGEDYTPPAEVCADGLDDLDADTLRRRLRLAIADRDRWKERAQVAEAALGQTKERNRFVTQATGANIAAAGKRITLIELKKEIDTAAGDGRQDGDWNRIRPSYMGRCTNQNKGTISTHLGEFEREGWIERTVKKVKDPDTGKWTSATFVRTLVDLSDPSQVNLPAKPRGLHACAKCGSMKVKRHSILRCTCCGHEESAPEEWVNPKEVRDMEDEILAKQAAEAELQTTTQDSEPAEDAAAFFEQLPEQAPETLSCNMRSNKKDNSPTLPELQTTTHSKDVPEPTNQPAPAQHIILPNRYRRHAAERAGQAVTP